MKYQIQHTNHNVQKKVYAIKALRLLTGTSLKEAKKVIDSIDGTNITAVVEGHIDPDRLKEINEWFAEAGYEYQEAEDLIEIHLAAAVKAAIDNRKYHIAQQALSLLDSL